MQGFSSADDGGKSSLSFSTFGLITRNAEFCYCIITEFKMNGSQYSNEFVLLLPCRYFLKHFCPIDLFFFPFDEHNCEIQIMSCKSYIFFVCQTLLTSYNAPPRLRIAQFE